MKAPRQLDIGHGLRFARIGRQGPGLLPRGYRFGGGFGLVKQGPVTLRFERGGILGAF
jgi:hypothetical protein